MTPDNTQTEWQYLEERLQSGLRQLYFKGSKLKASIVWMYMLVEQESAADAAANWDLPVAAVEEAIRYCGAHQDLLDREAEDERKYLEDNGIVLEPEVRT